LQIRTGSQTAGLWLSNAANSSSSAFIGMASDNQVGFYGNTGALFGLTMNTTTGNVGIGLNGAAAQVPLQFSNALGLTKISLYRGSYGDVGIGAYGGELRLQNDIPNGKISLGVLETTGSFTELAKAERNGAFAFSIFGSLWVNGTTYASDARFKQNIAPIASPLEKLLRLNGVEYEMKTSEFAKNHFTPGRQTGLIAQEVEKVVPEAVSENNGYKGVDYARLVPLLIEAIKELKKEIELLKNKQ
jgi:Chaperone of endosialidase